MHEGEGEVLVEEVAQELAHAQVGPAAMDQQEALQEAELGEREVTGENSLHTLLTTDTHTDMSRYRERGRQRTEGRKRETEKDRYTLELNDLRYNDILDI